SELTTRYTGTLGTGTIAQAILEKLKRFGNQVEFRTLAPVAKIENQAEGASVKFLENGVTKAVHADSVIFAAPMSVAGQVIANLDNLDPEKSAAIRNTEMTDYAVHIVRVKGHPYRTTYDTWVHSSGDLSKPTDYILGRWQDPQIHYYSGMRNFEKDPSDD